MHEAAVGFQCPSCVAEGRKQTRQARTTYGGTRSTNPAQTSMVLIGLNVAVWIGVLATGGRASRALQQLLLRPDGGCLGVGAPGAASCRQAGGTWLPGVADGAYWQLMTSAFTHEAIWHIAFNMFAVYLLGPQLEALLGRARFLSLYLISALAGSTAVMWLSPQFQGTLGASGAVFGLFAAYAVIALRVKASLRPILTVLGINVAITVLGAGFISWQGHLGGFLGGLLVALVLVYSPRAARTRWQVTGMVAITLLLLAACAARVVALA